METKRAEAISKVKELVEDIDFSMLTTVCGDMLRSRPMSTQEFDELGNIWFFTNDDSQKTNEIDKDNRVNIAYSKPEGNKYVSISGRAEMVKDREKIKELWIPIHKA